MPEIQLPTAAKQDEILNKIRNVNKEIKGPFITKKNSENFTSEFRELLKIEGSGELLEVFLITRNNTDVGVRITVDDEVVFDFEDVPKGVSSGIVIATERNFSSSTSSTYPFYSRLMCSQLPVTQLTRCLILKEAITFKRSLKLESYQTSSSGWIIYQLT
ncbi:hypothetical protein ACFSY7_10430 [Kurthia populi]|uniref:Uncharacterized protein n=1 Tax=Kurthia populi TaxID=1562132 RepID=A0ABW5Y0V6_9BACL